jgi:hypothetical protein
MNCVIAVHPVNLPENRRIYPSWAQQCRLEISIVPALLEGFSWE